MDKENQNSYLKTFLPDDMEVLRLDICVVALKQINDSFVCACSYNLPTI